MTSKIVHTGPRIEADATLRQRLDLASDDRQRLVLYLQYAELFIREDAIKGGALIDEALLIALRIRDADAEAALRMYRGLAHLVSGSAVQAVAELTESYQHYLVQNSGNTESLLTTAKLALALGRAYLQLAERQNALEWLMSAVRYCDEIPGEPSIEVLLEAATLLCEMNRATEALRVLLRTLRICESVGNMKMSGRTHLALGTTYEILEKFDAARENFSQSVEIFKLSGDVSATANAMTHFSRMETRCGNLDAALDLALRAQAAFNVLYDRSGIVAAAIALGDTYEAQGEPGHAIEYYLRAYQLLPEDSADPLRLAILIRIGSYYSRNKEHDPAIFAFEQALAFAQRLGDGPAECRIHRELSVIYESLEQYATALAHARAAESMHQEQTSARLEDVFTEFQLNLNQERLERQLAEAQQRVLELERKVAEMQREMQVKVLELYEKREMLQELQTKFGKLHKVLDGAESPILNEIAETLASGTQQQEEKWEDLSHQFDASHRDFLSRLAQHCPTITSTEMKICSLVRLGLPAREIATLLRKSQRTVETHQATIRKKFQLSRTTSLLTFIASI